MSEILSTEKGRGHSLERQLKEHIKPRQVIGLTHERETKLTVLASKYNQEVFQANFGPKLRGGRSKASTDSEARVAWQVVIIGGKTHKAVQSWAINVLVEVAGKPVLLPLDPPKV